MKAVIFLGPSLALAEARQVLDAIYLPPAAQSDLLSVIGTYQPDVIGLIDGVFQQSLSVWHKEILFAIERGVRVFGASSMGALRAAETDVFGMVGVGEIYRQYASGELTDDDEVALVYGQSGEEYLPASEPMVNIRATLRRAAAEGVIDDDWSQRLIAWAKALFYPDRDYPAILRRAREDGLPNDAFERLSRFVATSAVDQKRLDALALLATVRDLPDPLPPLTKPFTMTRSHLFEAQYERDRTVRHREIDVPLASIGDYAALHAPDFNELNFAALNRSLVTILATLLEIDVSEDDVKVERWRFRLKYGLKADDALTSWLAANDLNEDEFADLMHQMAICRRLHRWYMVRQHFERTTKDVLDELRLRNQYERYADEAAEQERILRDHFPDFQETDPDALPWQEIVLDHLRETDGKMELPAPMWAEEAGFRDHAELCIELNRARLARHYRRDLVNRLLNTVETEPGSNPGPAEQRNPM